MKTNRFLVVDDVEVNRILLDKILGPFGDVVTVNDGKQCLDTYLESLHENKPFDVIFLDILMPIMDGQEALTQIREYEASHGMDTGHEVKIVMVTSLDDWKNALDSFKKGVAEYIPKPIDRMKIIELLGRLGFT